MKKKGIFIVTIILLLAVATAATIFAVIEKTNTSRSDDQGVESRTFEVVQKIEKDDSTEPFERTGAEPERILSFMGDTIPVSYVTSQNRAGGFVSDVYRDEEGGEYTLNEEGILLGFRTDVTVLDESLMGDGDLTEDEAVAIARNNALETFGTGIGNLDLVSIRNDGDWYTVTLGEKLGPDCEIEGTRYVAMILFDGSVFSASCNNCDMLDGFDRSRLDGLSSNILQDLLDNYLADNLGANYCGMEIRNIKVVPFENDFALKIVVFPSMAVEGCDEPALFGTDIYVSIP